MLAFLFGWNNSSYLIGNLRGSGSLSALGALLVEIIGLLAGVLLSGEGMFRSLNGELSPAMPVEGLLATYIISILITFALSVMSLPVSLTMAMVGSFTGAAFSLQDGINVAQLGKIVAFWFLAPLLTALVAAAVYRLFRRTLENKGLFAMDAFSRIGVVLVSFFVAYSLGANNIGLIYGSAGGTISSPLQDIWLGAVVLATTLGVLLLGSTAVAKNLGDRAFGLSPLAVLATFTSSSIIVLSGVLLHVPVSMGQCVLGGMFGTAFSKRPTLVNTNIFLKIVTMWVVVPLASFGLAALLLAH
ncbi:MAG: inorganic phosphate transporter [Thermoprotei archaeon]